MFFHGNSYFLGCDRSIDRVPIQIFAVKDSYPFVDGTVSF